MDGLQQWIERLVKWINSIDLLDGDVQRYIVAGVIIFICLVFKRLLGNLLTRTITPLVKRSRTNFDDLLLGCLRRPLDMLVVIIGLAVALQIVTLPTKPVNFNHFSSIFIKALFTFNFAWVFYNAVAILEHTVAHWAHHTDSPLDENLLPFIRKIIRGFIIIIAIVLVIQNLGYSISGLLASLGIGGLAVALAAQDTLSNVFGSVMILLDRPFKVGDWVKTGDLEGTVEEIGFRSTKIRTFAKTLISVPNNIIANSSLNNFSRMPKRRIKMTIGVTYSSTPEQMRAAVEQIRSMLREHRHIDQEFILVNFTDFSASSLDILVYCFTSTTRWDEYLRVREDVCLQIMDIIAALGMEMAFPSRSIYIQHEKPATAANQGVES